MEFMGESFSTTTYDMELPYSLEAEQSVLGAVLVDTSCLAVVMDDVGPESFFREQHKRIFEIYVRMFTTASPIDFITVLEQVRQENIFETENDAKIYLTQLVQIVPSTANIEAYAKIVKEKHYIRSLITAARDIIENARDGQADAQSLMDLAEQRIYEIRQGREASGLERINTVIVGLYDKLQRLSGDEKDSYLGLSTGFGDLDRVLTGLNKSDLVLLAARPGMGKTAFALNIAAAVARKEKKVAVFSLEMSKEQLVERMLSSEASIQGSKMRVGEIGNDEWVRLAMAAQKLSSLPLYIDDSAGITVHEIKARLRRMKDLGLVVIDYLQLMTSSSRSDNRVQVISEITRSLKVMAKELDVPVVLLSQLSRGPEARTDHRPMLSDLRESGSIEQDADIVLFLYRDAYYNRDSAEQNVAECIIAKNRHGEMGIIPLGWDGAHTKFTGMERFHHEP
ncbi:replicative DNA helicase [Oscillospiraceae bacterium MB08-C2-2]|nr:replicative DNA helicase [Oscillospiraceae bacterium MB08-C2-2]